MCCTQLVENTGRKKSPFWHHRTTLSDCIFTAEACIDNWKTKLLNVDTSSTCLHYMVNFGLLTAEMCWRVWGTPANFNGFCVLAALLHGMHSSSGRQPNFAALNRGRHLCLAGRPSRCALAHIVVIFVLCNTHKVREWVSECLSGTGCPRLSWIWPLNGCCHCYCCSHDLLERCNPWPHVANRHISSISQLLSLWRHSGCTVIS